MPGNLYQCHCLAHDDRFCLHSRRAQEAAGTAVYRSGEHGGCFTSSCTPFMPPVGSINLSGALQLTAAVLLITQRHAPVGAALAAPILVTILVFCWSTGVVPTAIVVTLMSVGLLALILWDMQRWKALLGLTTPAPPPAHSSGQHAALEPLRLAHSVALFRQYGDNRPGLSAPGCGVVQPLVYRAVDDRRFTCGDLRSGLTAGERLSVLERVAYTRAVERQKP